MLKRAEGATIKRAEGATVTVEFSDFSEKLEGVSGSGNVFVRPLQTYPFHTPQTYNRGYKGEGRGKEMEKASLRFSPSSLINADSIGQVRSFIKFLCRAAIGFLSPKKNWGILN